MRLSDFRRIEQLGLNQQIDIPTALPVGHPRAKQAQHDAGPKAAQSGLLQGLAFKGGKAHRAVVERLGG
ncbi:MAG: hypothetical protein Q7T22_07650 [Serpentinimonas sp.]|nr:hypothetical protein [Serpentinimonas sp.]MDO9612570.1 hypothetical protein [Serpentinimonas sp.]